MVVSWLRYNDTLNEHNKDNISSAPPEEDTSL
jgi:hypothetical protein